MMEDRWEWSRFRLRIALLLVLCLLNQNLKCCWSLNAEGLALLKFREGVVEDPYGALSNWNRYNGDEDPCSWFGIECSDGKVVILNLKDLCLRGTLASGLGNLIHIKSIVLRNNSFSGLIPKEVGELKELEILDLGYNNFSGPLPFNLGNSLSLAILLLDNNNFLSISAELQELNMLSELQVDENQIFNTAQGADSIRSLAWNNAQDGDVAFRRLVQVTDAPRPPKDQTNKNQVKQPSQSESSPSNLPASSPSPSDSLSPLPSFISSPSLSPSSSPSPSPSSFLSTSPSRIFQTPELSPAPTPDLPSPAPLDPPLVVAVPSPSYSAPLPSISESPPPSEQTSGNSKHRVQWPILSGAVGAGSFLLISVFGVLFCRRNKAVTVKPWTTGLSGQLQKAFVTGVPKLKRSELETACEDFSNIIGSSLDGTVYKGTLSSGVEIAVTSTAVSSSKDWSKLSEAQFRKKIGTLSKVNHKNFVNLLGYCEEDVPFTRMMVLEYAPNGTLFEHLHIKEAEHLDWTVRLRIAMGMAYCLEHMHQLTPPVIHKNLQSSTIFLTEDYAAKISYHDFWNEVSTVKMGSSGSTLDMSSSGPESNVYSFGVILLEMITGKLPYFVDNGPLVDWASQYLKGEKPVKDMLDPTLKSFQEKELEKLCEVISSCIHANPKQRPTMRKVTAQLREITAMAPDGATPKLSPLWWAELEILSTEAT